ncbi:Arabinose operon regulatory protein [termite gut metagenome]|uniref:Arabinose operon regulatory protein n=1 Tax=termite gut metagenome TaxID=433724 RepID=A0A5J4QUI9_9ZZZZ
MKGIINIDFDRVVKEMTSSEVFGNELIVSNLHNRRDNSQRTENMPTVRLDALTFFMCTHGEILFHVDYKDYHLHGNMLLQLNRIHILNNVRMSSHFEGYMVAISPKLAESIMADIHLMKNAFISRALFLPLIEFSELETNSLIEIIVRIIKIMKNSDHDFQNYILKNEVSTLLMEVANFNLKRNKNKEVIYETIGHKEEIAQNFIRLVFEYCKENHEVSFYAEKLCMTSGNLSRILKTISGKTAIKWIGDTLLVEAKILLQKPNINVQQVADGLHFGDQSSFSKFFKKHTGQTPTEFKNKVQEVS